MLNESYFKRIVSQLRFKCWECVLRRSRVAPGRLIRPGKQDTLPAYRHEGRKDYLDFQPVGILERDTFPFLQQRMSVFLQVLD
jgi:hypothetical protein